MIVGVPAEAYPGERRVALVPAVVPTLVKQGLQVMVEPGAGAAAGFADADYQAQGASLASDRRQLFAVAHIVLQVRGLGATTQIGRADLELLHSGHVLVGLLNPLGAPKEMLELARRGVTAFALELVPRISRAQSMDALTSMATVAGYKAILLAATALPRMLPMMMTAAGTITPARVLVIGAGVAGLQAIATAHRLGAVVQAYDVRPAVKEQVESVGGKFLELPLDTQGAEAAGGYARAMGQEFYQRQQEMIRKAVAESDVVITTASVPGGQAPRLISAEMVRQMRHGSIIVDLAAETGGNCELTRSGETVEAYGVTIMAPLNLPSSIPYHASQMYARNMVSFLQNIIKEGELRLNLEDEVIRDTLVTHRGEVTNTRLRELLGLPLIEPSTLKGL
ncbi:MAG: Re/Si-specific NAD(P)(+) transhydrogenase subunit alpha [Chloroflexota bacterium]